LFQKIKELNIKLKGFISASGIGYYGAINSNKNFVEEDAAGKDFIAKICVDWEKAASQFKDINVPVTIFRIGVVLTAEGGALHKMNTPLFLSSLGDGNQRMPWIHIEDLANLFLKAINEVEFKGVFNAVSPANDTNQSFTKTLGKVLAKWVLPVGVPSLILRLILGELAVILLKGSRVSSEKIAKHYQFKFKNLEKALEDLYN